MPQLHRVPAHPRLDAERRIGKAVGGFQLQAPRFDAPSDHSAAGRAQIDG
jgi:hypothetical protein